MRQFVETWLLLQLLLSPAQLSTGQTLPGLQQYAQQLADSRLFAGMVHVEQGGSTVLSKGFGLAHYELGVPMRNDHRYPIGSNTKLFTAIAAWQLHRAGKLSVFDPASKYLTNHTDLGLDAPWCPRVYGAPDSSPCQSPQVQHLLRMTGGIIGFDNCAYKPEAWQRNYCLGGAKSVQFDFDDYQALQIGAAGIGSYLRLTGTLKLPLEFQPGSGYHYSNPGYSLAGYIVEQVAGMPLADYFRTNIFSKHSLTSTLYDPTDGILGTHKGQLPYPAYITYLQPGQTEALTDTAGAALGQLAASAGNPAYWGGDADDAAAVDSVADANTDSAAAGSVSVGMTAKYPGPSGFDWTLANAAGAIVSTPQDMAKWFRALLVEPDHLGLGKDLLREFLTLSTEVPGMPSFTVSSEGRIVNATLTFAQGLVVLKDLQHPRGLGVSNVYYLGSLGGFQASIYMWLHPMDASKDVFVNAVAATVLPDRSNWPEAVQNPSGLNCSSVNSVGSTGDSFKAVDAGTPHVADPGSSGGQVGADGNAIGRRLLGIPLGQTLLVGKGPTADVSALLCELSTMSPSAIKTVPDLLARTAYKALMGRDWFDMQ